MGLNLSRHKKKEEVKVAVWEFGNTKSPRPDGLNFKFIKEL